MILKTPTVVLTAITLLGLMVRLYGLTNYGIWFDEGYHIQLVQLPTVGAMLDAVLSNPPSDPLYVLLLRGWVALFGHGDTSVRLLSVLFSTATLPATYWLGSVMAGRIAGLLGALLLALSPYAVELGQEAALYALASLTTTLALAAGWHWRSTGKGGLLYIILGVVAIYSHYVVAPSLPLFALLALHPSAGPRGVSIRAWLGAHAAILTSWLPWLALIIAHWLSSPLARANLPHPADLADVLSALVQFTSGTASLQQTARALQVLGLVAGAGLLALGWLAGSPLERRALHLVVVLWGIIFIAPAAVSAATGLWLFVPHFVLFLLPALFIVLGAGASGSMKYAVRSVKWRNTNFILHTSYFILSLWLVAQLWGLALYNRYPPHGADGLRELAATLRQEVQPGDAVLVTPSVLTATLQQYYPGQTHGIPADFDLRAVYLPYEPARWYADSLASIERRVTGHSRFWLLYRPELDQGGKLLNTLQSHYKLLEQRKYIYSDLYLFSTKP